MPTIGIFESGLDEAFWEKGRSDKEVAAEILIGGSARDEGDSFI